MLQKFIESNQGTVTEPSRSAVIEYAKTLLADGEDATELRPFFDITQLANTEDQFTMARQIFLSLCKQRKYEGVVRDLEHLDFSVLQEAVESCNERLNYRSYCDLRERVAKKSPDTAEILTAQFFLQLPQAENTLALAGKTRAEIEEKAVFRADLMAALHHLLLAKQHRLQLDGFTLTNELTEEQLQVYIEETYGAYDNQITEDTSQFYVCYVSKSIMFLLDPRRTRRVSVLSLVSSQYLQCALSLQSVPIGRLFGPLAQQGQVTVFSLASFQQAYYYFQQASSYTPEANGLLTLDDTQHLAYAPTRAFAEAWYHSLELYNGCADFRQYMDYFLALSYPCCLGAGYFVFSVLDSQQQKGFLSRADIEKYFGEIYATMLKMFPGSELSPASDFVDEIFDNVKPRDGHNIYFADLQRTNSAEYLVRYLASVESLVEKENLAQNQVPNINDVPWSCNSKTTRNVGELLQPKQTRGVE